MKADMQIVDDEPGFDPSPWERLTISRLSSAIFLVVNSTAFVQTAGASLITLPTSFDAAPAALEIHV
jgi:hypothetical protein